MESSLETRFSSNHIYVRTPGKYAMSLAIDILYFVDEQSNYFAKNTGWKDGFGLEVCERTPIKSENLLVEIETDGEEFEIHLVSGDKESFSSFTDLVIGYLNEVST